MTDKIALVLCIVAILAGIYFAWCFRQYCRQVTPYIFYQQFWEDRWRRNGFIALGLCVVAALAAWVLA